MSEIINLPEQGQDYIKLAVDKIAGELKTFKGGNKETAVKNHVASTITRFCEENKRFAEVVYKTKRTLSDCCAEIMKGCGNHISDIDVYRGAVKNYFPNADINFQMTIAITGDAPTEAEMNRMPEKPEPIPKKEKPKAAAPEFKKKDPMPLAKPEKKELEYIQLSLF